MKFEIAPTGKIIKGHVFDVNPRQFTEKLKQYDPHLYVKWNSKKLKGWGCWEIRRATTEYRITNIADISPTERILKLDYPEIDIVNHVLDCAFLNYDAIRKLKEMDTFRKDHFIHTLEADEATRKKEIKAKAREELKYAIRHNKSLVKKAKDLVESGVNPAELIAPKNPNRKW